MRATVRAMIAAMAAVATMAAGYHATARDASGSDQALGPGPVTVVVEIEHSAFTPSALRVRRGTEVRFVVDNDDPINHELIVGPPEIHDRHRDGTEAQHGVVDGEVSVPAGARALTSYTFDRTGTVEMACHLPGHYDFGMRGTIEVIP